ncbi:hypothetical protein LX36DRAFT_71065 [Colletotrichum falcatum]|nr:hypothetical protein LX36DRAFT_71065 [Colletotrichum falcatum]
MPPYDRLLVSAPRCPLFTCGIRKSVSHVRHQDIRSLPSWFGRRKPDTGPIPQFSVSSVLGMAVGRQALLSIQKCKTEFCPCSMVEEAGAGPGPGVICLVIFSDVRRYPYTGSEAPPAPPPQVGERKSAKVALRLSEIARTATQQVSETAAAERKMDFRSRRTVRRRRMRDITPSGGFGDAGM